MLVQIGDLSFDTVYMGGGTPSLFDPSEIRGIIDAVRHRFTLEPDTEITLEVNPGTVGQHRLAAYRQSGVNRINIGKVECPVHMSACSRTDAPDQKIWLFLDRQSGKTRFDPVIHISDRFPYL